MIVVVQMYRSDVAGRLSTGQFINGLADQSYDSNCLPSLKSAWRGVLRRDDASHLVALRVADECQDVKGYVDW